MLIRLTSTIGHPAASTPAFCSSQFCIPVHHTLKAVLHLAMHQAQVSLAGIHMVTQIHSVKSAW